MITRAIGGRSSGVSAVAGFLFLAIFGLRLAVADPESAILLLCVIPTALLAVQFGLRGGLLGALLSCVLVAVWALVEAPSLGFVGAATRAVTFLVVGGMVGWIVDRRRSLEARNTRQFELSLDLLGVAGFDGYFKWVNPAFERALGYSAAEFCSVRSWTWCTPRTVRAPRPRPPSSPTPGWTRSRSRTAIAPRTGRTAGSSGWCGRSRASNCSTRSPATSPTASSPSSTSRSTTRRRGCSRPPPRASRPRPRCCG